MQAEKMYFILTAKSLLWVTLSVVSTITLFTAIYSPKWLIGPTDYNCLSKSPSAECKFMKIKRTLHLIILGTLGDIVSNCIDRLGNIFIQLFI